MRMLGLCAWFVDVVPVAAVVAAVVPAAAVAAAVDLYTPIDTWTLVSFFVVPRPGHVFVVELSRPKPASFQISADYSTIVAPRQTQSHRHP